MEARDQPLLLNGCESPSDLMEARDQPLLLKVGVRAPLTSVEQEGVTGD
jgi:hypothetical protein